MTTSTVSAAEEAAIQGLRVLQAMPVVAETPLERLDGVVTPAELFYLRENFPRPSAEMVAPETFRLTIDGLVERPGRFSLRDLAGFPAVAETVTFECAGNNRSYLRPRASGNQFEDGAVSTGVWAGVRLRDVLTAAGVRPEAIEVVAEGADSGEPDPGESVVPFQRSLRLDDPIVGEALLATRLNGEPIPLAHGGPLRVVVPRWYGMASVKWVSRLTLVDTPFVGPFQTDRYVLRQQAGEVGEPLGPIRVKSVIAWPRPNAEVLAGRLAVRGYAWSGSGAITAVEVSPDGGQSWAPARVDEPASASAWQLWRVDLTLFAGETTLIARATDAAGSTQPERGDWNQRGYANNGWARATVTVT